MPTVIGPIAGNECKLYYNATLAATFTVSGSVLVTDAVDVSVTMAAGKADVMSRASPWKTKVPTLDELSLSFGYLYNSDVGDTLFNAIRAAYLAKTPWHWAVLDNINATPGVKGAQGITFPGIITEFNHEQPLEGVVLYNIVVDPIRTKVSGSIVNPAWLTVAAS
jgi:hypothetical protein